MKILMWKPFHIDVEQVRAFFKSSLGENYNGLICDEISLQVMFKAEPSEGEEQLIDNYWNSITEETFAHGIQVPAEEIALLCMRFGRKLMAEIAVEPTVLALNPSELAQLIDRMTSLHMMLLSGALPAFLAAMQTVETDAIITTEMVNKYTTKVQEFLGTLPSI